jgi:CBS domain-containing protein
VLLQGLSAHEVLVGEVMSTTVVTVSPHDSVAHCMELMTNQRLRHLPVVEEGHVVGLISIGDAVKAQISDQEQLISGLESYIHGTSAVAHPQAG